MSVLASLRPQPPLTRLPLGRHWLWLGAIPGSSEDSLEEKLRRIQRVLAEVYFRCGARHLELVRAHGLFLARVYAAAERRLFRQSAAGLYAALEAERRRIARDLHDSASQLLTGIRLNLEAVERHLDSANTEALARLNKSKNIVALALGEIHRISHALSLPDFDFSEAVESLVETTGLRDKLQVEIGPILTPKDLLPRVKAALFGVLQEGLTNVVKHSGATRVRIEARLDSGGVRLALEDDGRGFDPAALRPGGGMGLKNMRERVKSVGGRLEISSAPGRGVRLRAVVPLGGRARAAGAGAS